MHLDDVLRPNPRLDVTLLAGPWDKRMVERVRVLESTDDVGDCRRGDLAVLTRQGSRHVTGAALIDLLRHAGEREMAAVGLYGRAMISQAVIGAASGAGVALLAVGVGEGTAELAFRIEEVLRLDPAAVLVRLSAAMAAIDQAERGGTEAILVAASAALGTEVRFTGGRVIAASDEAGVRIGCRLAAEAIARSRRSDPQPSTVTTPVVLIEALAEESSDVVALEALRTARDARLETRRNGAAVELIGAGPGLARQLIARLSADVVCGIGATRAEAAAALRRARAAGAVNAPFAFDADDPEALIDELAGSPTARVSAAALLAPLERLEPRKAATAIETLRVYLDCWGSLHRAGEVLHLHPNAVAYRMKRIRSLLPANLDDPDQRLGLQIACRALARERFRRRTTD